MKKTLFLFVLLISSIVLQAKKIETPKVEPPNWWVGMEITELQLLVYHENIAEKEVKVNSELVDLVKINKVESPNYLFLDLKIKKETKAGNFDIEFYEGKKLIAKYTYELKEKAAIKRGFSSEDVVYLLMPDRFANGDKTNDSTEETLEKADRSNLDGRHGGDIQGIINNLDYIENLGITALWGNPFLENNMPNYSYHGYGITDFYKVDSRFGTNDDFKKLADELHQRDMKIIQDMVFNHCGSNHWWMKDLPEKSWLNNDKNFTTNYRGGTVVDPHASDYDFKKMVSGWFVDIMPDLNQNNEYLANYLIQNSIWWVEFAGLDGIRMDTQPYAFKEMMANWAERLHLEYPDLTLLGETWLQTVPFTAYFQGNNPISGDYNSNLDCVTDFPLYYSIKDGLNEEESWTGGIFKLYYTLAQDFLYSAPNNVVIFADNHDLERFYTSVHEDLDKFKMGMGFLLTTRGIPVIYYGTEILMTGYEHLGHGNIRMDFPGGWEDDENNAFTKEGRTEEQNVAYDFVENILNWRKTSVAVKTGELMHFVPEDNVYVFFRYTDDEAVMVLMNNHNTESRTIDCQKFQEIINDYSSGKEIISGKEFSNLDEITISKKSIMIIDLEK